MCEPPHHTGDCHLCRWDPEDDPLTCRRHVLLMFLSFWGVLFELLGQWILERTEEIETKWCSPKNRLLS